MKITLMAKIAMDDRRWNGNGIAGQNMRRHSYAVRVILAQEAMNMMHEILLCHLCAGASICCVSSLRRGPGRCSKLIRGTVNLIPIKLTTTDIIRWRALLAAGCRASPGEGGQEGAAVREETRLPRVRRTGGSQSGAAEQFPEE